MRLNAKRFRRAANKSKRNSSRAQKLPEQGKGEQHQPDRGIRKRKTHRETHHVGCPYAQFIAKRMEKMNPEREAVISQGSAYQKYFCVRPKYFEGAPGYPNEVAKRRRPAQQINSL